MSSYVNKREFLIRLLFVLVLIFNVESYAEGTTTITNTDTEDISINNSNVDKNDHEKFVLRTLLPYNITKEITKDIDKDIQELCSLKEEKDSGPSMLFNIPLSFWGSLFPVESILINRKLKSYTDPECLELAMKIAKHSEYLAFSRALELYSEFYFQHGARLSYKKNKLLSNNIFGFVKKNSFFELTEFANKFNILEALESADLEVFLKDMSKCKDTLNLINEKLGIIKKNYQEFLKCYFLFLSLKERYNIDNFYDIFLGTFCSRAYLEVSYDKFVIRDRGLFGVLWDCFVVALFMNNILLFSTLMIIGEYIGTPGNRAKNCEDILGIIGIAFLVVGILNMFCKRCHRPIYVALSKKLKYIQDFIFGMEKIYNIIKKCPLYFKLGSVLEYCKKIFDGEGLDDEQKELMGLLRSVPNNWSYWTWLTNNVKKISRLFILFEKLKDMFLPAFVEICRIDGYMSLFKLRNDESFMRHWSTPNFIESKGASLYIKDAFLPIMDPEKVVKNSICLGKRRKEEEGPCEEHDVELLVGMNAGGKTFFLETILANVLLSKVFGVTPAAEYESTNFDDVFYFSCGGSDIESALSRYQVELKNVSELFEKVEKSPKGSRFLVLFDELFSSTDSASAKRMLIYTINRLAKSKKCLIVGATHIMDIDTIKKLFPDLKVKIYHMGVDVDDDGGVVFKHTKNEGMPKISVAEELFKEKLGIDTLGF